MNRLATVPARSAPALLALLDLSVENERLLHGAIARTHDASGASRWRMLDIQRRRSYLVELAERQNPQPVVTQRFEVLTWIIHDDGIELRMQRKLYTRRGATRVYNGLLRSVSG